MFITDWFARGIGVIGLAVTIGTALLGWMSTYLRESRERGIMEFFESNVGMKYMDGWLENWQRRTRRRR